MKLYQMKIKEEFMINKEKKESRNQNNKEVVLVEVVDLILMKCLDTFSKVVGEVKVVVAGTINNFISILEVVKVVLNNILVVSNTAANSSNVLKIYFSIVT